ncbi:MAG: hypothetical protein IJS58_02635 [Bacilli bacterium]|jgi:uncharacterized coiled-coil protein SlyX/lysophospholipase L1-like esterase|nr:hypothetical protein [Bacilli bacterium]
MKKLFNCFIFILVGMFVFLLTACEEADAIKNYESRIIALETALAEQEELLGDYEFRIQDLEDELGKTKNSIKSVQTRVGEIETTLNTVSSDVTNLKGTSDTSVQVYLADQYYLVVNDNFQLFYRSVIRAVDPYGYYIKVTGDKGHALNRYFEFKPDTVGTYQLKIEVCDSNGHVLGSDSTKLVVVDSKKANATEKTILCIGDSLTSNGVWVARGVSKYVSAGGKATTIGTITTTSGGKTYKYEGRSGWQWSSYLSKYDSSTMSPFAPTGSNPSIRDYCTRNGFGEITDFYIMMTFNGLPGSYTEFTFDTPFIQQAKTLIDLIHSEYPNAKISLMNLPLTSTRAGLGAYYQISSTYSDNYGKAVTVLHYGDFLEKWCKMSSYKSFMRYVDIKAQFDSEYNMPYETKSVNNTNTSEKETVGNAMGMHPSTNGYNQIGDAVYRALMSNW